MCTAGLIFGWRNENHLTTRTFLVGCWEVVLGDIYTLWVGENLGARWERCGWVGGAGIW